MVQIGRWPRCGDCPVESAAILDYPDGRVGPERALMPPPSALTALNTALASPLAAGERLTQADTTAGVMYDMIDRVHPNLLPQGAFPALDAPARRCRAMPEFQRAKIDRG